MQCPMWRPLCFTGSCTAVRVQGVDIIIKVFYFYVLSMSVGVHVYVPCKCLVLLWSSGRYWIPWNWSYNGSVVSQYVDAVNSTGALWRSKCHYPLSHHSSSLMVLFLISIMLKIYQTFALNSHPTVEESNVSLYYTWGKWCIKAWSYAPVFQSSFIFPVDYFPIHFCHAIKVWGTFDVSIHAYID